MRQLRDHARITRLAWLEYCAASQYGKSWGVVEDVLTMRYVLSDRSPPPEAEAALKSERSPVGYRWIESHAGGPPPHFIRDEIGYWGDDPSIFSTSVNLKAENERRRKEYEATEQTLAAAAKTTKKRKRA